jgi:hypothetical protein
MTLDEIKLKERVLALEDALNRTMTRLSALEGVFCHLQPLSTAAGAPDLDKEMARAVRKRQGLADMTFSRRGPKT